MRHPTSLCALCRQITWNGTWCQRCEEAAMPRAGGDKRGNAVDRRRRKVWMLATFDTDLGPDKARCQLAISDNCREVLTFATVSADRIDPGGSYAHENVQPACVPCQNKQGALITRERRHQWFDWMAEAQAAGIPWDGTL